MPPASSASRPPGRTPPPLRDDLIPRRFIDFQRAGVALFAAGVLALGIGIATGSKADGKSTPAVASFTPVAQVVAPPNAGPDVPVAPANPAPPPANNTAPPGPAPANPAPPPGPAP